MVTRPIAESSFKDARTWYESGFKSSNKNYDVDAAPWYKRWFGGAEQRNADRAVASTNIKVTRSSGEYLRDATGAANTRIEKGRILYNGRLQAGNCDELTNVACFRANARGALIAELRAASLAAPADHVFCIYAEATLMPLFDGTRLSDLATAASGLGSRALAIDPWANTCCRLEEYPDKLAAKMRKWLRDGKRVSWKGADGAHPGFYPTATGPNGYATIAMNAAVVLRPAG